LFQLLFLRVSKYSRARKQPRKKVHRRDCHANAEHHTRKNPFRTALAESDVKLATTIVTSDKPPAMALVKAVEGL